MPAGPIGSCWAADSWEETAWEINSWADAVALAFVLDLNTRLLVYLRSHYSEPTGSFESLMQRYFAENIGEMTARFRKLIRDATDAMS